MAADVAALAVPTCAAGLWRARRPFGWLHGQAGACFDKPVMTSRCCALVLLALLPQVGGILLMVGRWQAAA